MWLRDKQCMNQPYWVESPPCGQQASSSGNAVLFGLCACCLVLIIFSAVMGSSPAARDRVAVQCRSLLERFSTTKKAAAVAAAPASERKEETPSVQLAETDIKKTYGAFNTHLAADAHEPDSVVAPAMAKVSDEAFDVGKMMPTKTTEGGDDFKNIHAGLTAKTLRQNIFRADDASRCAINTQNGYKRLFQGDFLLHDRRKFYEGAKQRLRQIRAKDSDDCPFAEFYASSHSYDTADSLCSL